MITKYCLAPEQIEETLRRAGIQPTAQRIAIGRYVLCGEADHPTAEQVKEWTDRNFPKLSLATVYNTLGALVNAGLLKEIKEPQSSRIAYDHNIEPHYHFFDTLTGQLVDIPSERVKVDIQLEREFKVNQVEVLLRGTRV